MVDFVSNDRLIRMLATDLTPVCRLASPTLRVLAWLALVVGIAAGLIMAYDVAPMLREFSTSFDLCTAAVGSTFTAVLASVAAFQLSLPDRKPGWAMLPLPAAVLWISANAIGCLGPWAAVAAGTTTFGGTDDCLFFILGVSMPLSILLMFMLRSGYSLRPNLTSTLCGLASGAASATLLYFVHPHDATATDLAVHAFAVCAVVLANRIFGSRFLMTKKFGLRRNRPNVPFELRGSTTFKPKIGTPQDWREHVKNDVVGDRPKNRESIRTDHQGHIIRFHR